MVLLAAAAFAGCAMGCASGVNPQAQKSPHWAGKGHP